MVPPVHPGPGFVGGFVLIIAWMVAELRGAHRPVAFCFEGFSIIGRSGLVHQVHGSILVKYIGSSGSNIYIYIHIYIFFCFAKEQRRIIGLQLARRGCNVWLT